MRLRLLAAVLCCWVTALTIAPTTAPQYAPIVDSFVLPPTSGIVIDAVYDDQAAPASVEQPHP